MKHKTKGLARKCNAFDLFHSGTGLQCGNCLAYEENIHITKDTEQEEGEQRYRKSVLGDEA